MSVWLSAGGWVSRKYVAIGRFITQPGNQQQHLELSPRLSPTYSVLYFLPLRPRPSGDASAEHSTAQHGTAQQDKSSSSSNISSARREECQPTRAGALGYAQYAARMRAAAGALRLQPLCVCCKLDDAVRNTGTFLGTATGCVLMVMSEPVQYLLWLLVLLLAAWSATFPGKMPHQIGAKSDTRVTGQVGR